MDVPRGIGRVPFTFLVNKDLTMQVYSPSFTINFNSRSIYCGKITMRHHQVCTCACSALLTVRCVGWEEGRTDGLDFCRPLVSWSIIFAAIASRVTVWCTVVRSVSDGNTDCLDFERGQLKYIILILGHSCTSLIHVIAFSDKVSRKSNADVIGWLFWILIGWRAAAERSSFAKIPSSPLF